MTPEERATQVCRDSGWTIEPWKYDLIVAAIRATIAESLRLTSYGLINAAHSVRRDGGSEERARTFEDAAYIVWHDEASSTQEIYPKTPSDGTLGH